MDDIWGAAVTAHTTRLCVIYALSLDSQAHRYVGLTTRGLALRLREHFDDARSRQNRPLHYWLRKHGEPAIHAVALETHDNPEHLKDRERFWIAELQTFAGDRMGGLNSTRGGDGMFGYRHTAETRARIAEAGRGREFPHRRAKHRVCRIDDCKDVARSLGMCSKHYQRMRKYDSIQLPTRISWNAGLSWSEESRRRMSEASTGQVPWNQGRSATTDEVEKNRQAQLIRYQDEQQRTAGRANLAAASHVRWHVKRQISKDECPLCE